MDISILSSVGDKAIFITGGAKGIGRTISEGFVANGAKTYISTGDVKSCETSLTNAPRGGYQLTEGWDTIRLLVCRYEGCG